MRARLCYRSGIYEERAIEKKPLISFLFLRSKNNRKCDLHGESGTASAWEKSRACCSEVVCTLSVFEASPARVMAMNVST